MTYNKSIDKYVAKANAYVNDMFDREMLLQKDYVQMDEIITANLFMTSIILELIKRIVSINVQLNSEKTDFLMESQLETLEAAVKLAKNQYEENKNK